MVNYVNKNEPTYDCHLYRSFRKYGIDNFTFQVIELCNQWELDEKEIYWIQYYDSCFSGYNETFGGSNTQKINRDDFINYYKQNNCTVQEIAEVFGIDRTVAGKILKEVNIIPKYYISPEEEIAICNDYLADKSNSCIKLGNKYHRDPNTISNVLKRNNITVLPSGSSGAKKIWVYDVKTNELIMEGYIKDFYNYLIDNGIVEKPSISTIQTHIKRQGMKLYKKYYVRDYKVGD